MLPAIQVNWTKPYFDRSRLRGETFKLTRELESSTYDMPDYQIFYTMLSAIHWKQNNGSLKLYTDSIGLDFIHQFNMSELYDEIDINFLNGYSKTNIDSARFWTSGKIKVLAHQTKPFIFLDQDMIFRSKVPDSLFEKDLTITHWEITRPPSYFTEDDWKREIPSLEFPKGYTPLDHSPNTSFLVINNMELLKKYTQYHKKLVEVDIDTPNWYWLLTDQGILGHIIRENEYSVDTLTDRIFLSSSNGGTKKTRKFGKSEPWYYPTSKVNKKKEKIKWEHIWLEKIYYGISEEYHQKQTQRLFYELVHRGYGDKLQQVRFKKYWDENENYKNTLG
jgi:hypothetical protein